MSARAWLFGLDETAEQTGRIAEWFVKQEHQKAEKLLGLRAMTDEEISTEVYKRFIEQFQPKQIIIPFPRTLLSTLGFEVLRVRGDLSKLLAFAKLYAMLNVKRLEKINDDVYVLSPQVALEALNIALAPMAAMLSRIDDRTKTLFSALKTIVDIKERHHGEESKPVEIEIRYDKKGAEITKAVREKIATKIGKSEQTVRVFFNNLESSGVVSSDQKKPKTFTLLYDVEEIERKILGLSIKTKSIDVLMNEMPKEAQEWHGTGLIENSLRIGDRKIAEPNTSATPSIGQEKNLDPIRGKRIINPDLSSFGAASSETSAENHQNGKLSIIQEEQQSKSLKPLEISKTRDRLPHAFSKEAIDTLTGNLRDSEGMLTDLIAGLKPRHRVIKKELTTQETNLKPEKLEDFKSEQQTAISAESIGKEYTSSIPLGVIVALRVALPHTFARREILDAILKQGYNPYASQLIFEDLEKDGVIYGTDFDREEYAWTRRA